MVPTYSRNLVCVAKDPEDRPALMSLTRHISPPLPCKSPHIDLISPILAANNALQTLGNHSVKLDRIFRIVKPINSEINIHPMKRYTET